MKAHTAFLRDKGERWGGRVASPHRVRDRLVPLPPNWNLGQFRPALPRAAHGPSYSQMKGKLTSILSSLIQKSGWNKLKTVFKTAQKVYLHLGGIIGGYWKKYGSTSFGEQGVFTNSFSEYFLFILDMKLFWSESMWQWPKYGWKYYGKKYSFPLNLLSDICIMFHIPLKRNMINVSVHLWWINVKEAGL